MGKKNVALKKLGLSSWSSNGKRNILRKWLGGPSGSTYFLSFDDMPTFPTNFITFTRASTGTFTNTSGLIASAAVDTPRFQCNSSGVVQGLLIEPARTNLALYSEEIDNASWATGVASPAGVTANAATAPDGAVTAETMAPSSTNPFRRRIVASLTAGVVYTVSAYVKASASGGATAFRLTTNNTLAWGTGGSAKVTLTSSWQRVTLTFTQTGSASAYIVIGATDASGALDSSCYGNVDVWGLMFEAGSTATSYIKTVAGTVTRAADSAVFTMPHTTNSITYTFDNDSTQTVTGIAAGSYTTPTNLTRPIIKSFNVVAG